MQKKKGILWMLVIMMLIMVFGGIMFLQRLASSATVLCDFEEQITAKVLKNYWDGDVITASDIAIDQVYYGSFSQKDAKEVLVLCKILNQPHVAGLDKTVGMVLEQESLALVAYEEFAADKVELGCFQTDSGKNKVLFIGTTTYQGISAQNVLLFDIQGNEWIPMPVDALSAFADECFCFMVEDMLVVSSMNRLTSPAKVEAILIWDAVGEQFVWQPAYGVLAESLAAENIVWKEYPQSRKVEFTLNGRLTLTVPREYSLSLEELQNPDALKEISREGRSLSHGDSTFSWDEVVYEFNDASIASNFPKFSDKAKQDAASGYQLAYSTEDGQVVIGYILPMDNKFQKCTPEETAHWECTPNIDLDFLTLSRTYIDGNILSPKEQNPRITLEKGQNGVLDCTIKNEGDSIWKYSYMPAIEVWSQGVWLEIQSSYADPGVLKGCEGKQACDIIMPESALQGYPYFSPGLYRLVVYGDDNTYAATESFVID